MDAHSVTFSFFLIFSGAAALATLALYTRQPLIIAYIVLGGLFGPSGLGWVTDLNLLADIAHIGIIFLLFLLGLDMQPAALVSTLKKSTPVALLSSLAFFSSSALIVWVLGFDLPEASVIGVAMMFSSTIIGIKLLPTTVLHHRHIGEMMIGLLLLQDILAIIALIALNALGDAHSSNLVEQIIRPAIGLPLLITGCYLAVKHLLLPVLARFDRFQEYLFLVAIGWCLGIAELSANIGLSAEIGAFIAGVTIATSPISQYIAISLKPLRDFFLVLFFFSVGARVELSALPSVALAVGALSLGILIFKPLVYRALLGGVSERKELAWNMGFRLGQASEFSLLIAYVAVTKGLLSAEGAVLIQAVTIITLLASSYIVIMNFPTPIAIRDDLRRD
jgi:Kef-type K+ transport system membrane component KefB